MTCTHDSFDAKVNTVKVRDDPDQPTQVFMAMLSVTCSQCQQPFEFLGPDVGMAFDKPTCGIDRVILHAPMLPVGETLPADHGMVGYTVRKDTDA